MKCPISFANPDERGVWSDCDPRCAWLMEYGPRRAKVCAVAVLAASETDTMGFCPTNTEEVDDDEQS